jgi:hypothetical protein
MPAAAQTEARTCPDLRITCAQLDLTQCQMREVALIPGILHAIMIYCLPSMALLAWQLLRAERWEDAGERPIHIESSSASRYGGVPD